MAQTGISDERTNDAAGGGEGARGFLALIGVGWALAFLLWQVDGSPAAAFARLDLARLRVLFGASQVSDRELTSFVVAAGWVVLGYLAVTVTARLVLVGGARASAGATWARTGLRLTHVVTIPAVRRLVDGGVAGAVVLAGVRPFEVDETSSVERVVDARSVVAADGHETDGHSEQQRFVEYTVAPGDSLWEIARRFYGDGTRYVDIAEANRGRALSSGREFGDANLIEPGWALLLPLPAHGLDAADGALIYDVRPGDSLWAIAAAFLGDGFRWPEVWEANRAREMPDGRRLLDPGSLQPGWRLVLPVALRQDEHPSSPVPPTLPKAADEHASPTAARNGEAGRDVPPTVSEPAFRWPSVPRSVVVSAAGFFVIAGMVVLVQRLGGRVRARFAVSRREQGPSDAGRVAVAARALTQAVRDLGLADVRVLTVLDSGRGLEFELDGPPGLGLALRERATELSDHLGCQLSAALVSATRVRVTLSGYRRYAALLAASAHGEVALVVPVGANDRGVFYINLAAVGSVAVAGLRTPARQLLRSWVATLTATAGPEEVSFRCEEATAELLGDEVERLHFGGATEAATATALVRELEEAIESRSADGGRPLVALVSVNAATESELQYLLRRGPAVGIHVVGVAGVDAVFDASKFGATVDFAADLVQSERGVLAGECSLRLRIGQDEPCVLEQIWVRRDTSARWREQPAFPMHPMHDATPDDSVTGITRAAVEPSLGHEPELPGLEAVGPGPGQVVELPGPFNTELDATDEADCSTEGLVGEECEPAHHAATRQPALFGDLPERADTPVVGEPALELSCLGPFTLRVGGTRVTRWPLEKSKELLAFLAAHGGEEVSREVIADALWAGYPWDASTRHLIANAVSGIRSVVRAAVRDEQFQPILNLRQRLQLQPAAFRIDLNGFDELLRRVLDLREADALTVYEELIERFGGEFLEGASYEWADAYRDQYRRRLIDGAFRGAAIADGLGLYDRASRLYQAVVDRDPTDEVAVRGLMRALAAVGDVNGARRVYRALTVALREDLDDPTASPSAETTALLSEVAVVISGP